MAIYNQASKRLYRVASEKVRKETGHRRETVPSLLTQAEKGSQDSSRHLQESPEAERSEGQDFQ